jgi:hypothetical protein
MSQTGTKQIAFMINKYLGFVFESAKCCAVNDAVSIALKLAPGLWFRLGRLATQRVIGARSIRR